MVIHSLTILYLNKAVMSQNTLIMIEIYDSQTSDNGIKNLILISVRIYLYLILPMIWIGHIYIMHNSHPRATH